MPTYDFRCTECERDFEVTRPMTSVDPVSCPACGRDARRVFTPVGVAFKGSGFHNTDYKPRPSEDSGGSCPAKGDSSACATCPSAQ